MGDTVRIAFVGGGRTSMPLLEDFLKRSYIEVIGVADVDPDSPGAKFARDKGIFFTEHADVLAAKASEIDVIIEVSGDPTVKPALRDAFQAQGNRHTIILGSATSVAVRAPRVGACSGVSRFISV